MIPFSCLGRLARFARPGHRAWLALCLGSWLLCASAAASVVIALDLGELVHEADQVLVVTALREEARREAQGGLIVTDVELRVEEALKGAARAGSIVS